MSKHKLNRIWDQIEDDLSLQFEEVNKESLYAGIQELPSYQAPQKCWIEIENKIHRQTYFKITIGYIKIAASILVMLGIGLLIKQNISTDTKIQFTKVQDELINLYEISDTSHDSFLKIKNSTCLYNPSFCSSDEFKQFESEYLELVQLQSQILKKSSEFDDANQMETMLLKIESRKKNIQHSIIQQLN